MAVTLDSLKKSIGKKNSSSRAFAWLADLEREAGSLDQALQRVDGGLTLYPNDVAAMLVRAKILFQKDSADNYTLCVEECEKVLLADPFNLAALKIMGDAYDKLENIGERNACYRRLHDMDPLNTFWKDEYDVVVGGVAAAAMAGEISDTDFSMPDSTGSFDLSDEFTTEPSSSMNEVPSDEFNFDEPQVEDSAATAEPSADVGSDADDPFAALASMMPGSDDADDSAMEDLSASLDSAMDSIQTDESFVAETSEKMGDDEQISGSDVGSALSDMFGFDDDLEPEESSAPAAPAPGVDIPESIDENAEANASSVFGSALDTSSSIDSDEPTTIDNAFDSIFGEDELPEEKPQATEASEPVANDIELPAEDGGLFEKSADADMNLDGEWTPGPAPVEDSPIETSEPAAPAADEPTTIDNAFDSIFGEDELPEEKPQETVSAQDELTLEEPAAEESGLFEKSADADMNLDGEWTPGPASVDDDLKIDDELKLDDNLKIDEEPKLDDELKLEDVPAETSAPADEVFDLDAPVEELKLDEAPAEESSSVTLDETPAEEAPAAEIPAEETLAEPVEEKPANEGFSVDSAFDSLFGAEDDLPEEKPQTETVEPAPAEETASLAEQVDQAEAELEMPEVKGAESDIAKEMGGAFASMFGNDDDDLDLPESKPETIASDVSSQEATGASIEESFGKSSEEELSSDLDKSFDNLFGKEDNLEDDLNLQAPAADVAPVEAAAAEPAKDLDSLESEVSGAFKGLFDMEDDALPEEQPSNKGVDFLMSGDSDDEISAGLINNPDAPLDRGVHDLDDSLNTRTLAEIYFDQGLYGKALEIYKDLAQKEPANEEIAARMAEVEKLYNEKFGGNA